MLERQYPTPHEWTFRTRMGFRGAHCERDQTDPARVSDWIAIMVWIKGAIDRLEDPSIDGKALKDTSSDRPPKTKDTTAMSEEWRRGYYESMMMYAKAAEHLDGWVMDKTRNIVFPPDVVIGPSNPNRKPLPIGYTGAPKEEDCEVAYEPANDIYLRIISTEGFTSRQKLEARLAYANWLEFKGTAGPASIVFEEAVEQAISERPSLPAEPLSRDTWTFNEEAGLPSANLLKALTAYATFKARSGDISSALPMLVSILKARRSLLTLGSASDPSPVSRRRVPSDPDENLATKLLRILSAWVAPPAYPPPPPDGTSPPVRDAQEMCEEAGLSLNLGEIMYASQPTGREEGLGWTRDAVDVAEEQLHRLTPAAKDRDARTTCRDCLSTGLENWSAMVARLAREEAAKKEAALSQPKRSTWLGSLWGEGKKEDLSRWAAEEKVIEERRRRANQLLDDLEPPANGLSSIFSA
ncbi:hypothetical protein B0T25DRAFT_526955 [Lasiosphaeria hispida]|uniref:Uncharacterized protein n=1 Tax=Lasiosphaeria hispida TaxID=260671 RepID=A0AAJ0HVG2_9PEZI|nr:hypothetical protein B0T25DRAFT_526955 [Lasiosphaeria hispida]